MADLKLSMKPTGGDFILLGPDLAEDKGLQTAIIISLFSDRRAEDDDVVPGDPADRRGWWADAYAEIDGDLIGSRLWLLDRSKTTPDVVADAKAYAEEALAWLKDDEIAQKVAVRTGRSGDRLWIEVDVVRPNGGGVARYKHHNIWEALDALGTSDN